MINTPLKLLRLLGILILFGYTSLAAAQSSALFPRPAAMEPAIKFWTRVYTEVDTDNGFLHDSNNLAVVYEALHYDRPAIEKERILIQDALKVLATGKRSGLTSFQQDILDAWPVGTSNDTLRAAANNVRFQLGQSDRFVEGLIRSGAYRSHIESVIRGKELPIELGALPHVESSFHPGAYSSVAAAGMWQFMRATGQRFMRIDHIVDERMDPYTATYAAMSLLEYNYQILGTWPLALTAYNHGTGGMNRAVRETGSNKIEDIVANYKGPNFGFASRNFYAQFLAVLDVEKQAQTVFGVLQLDPSPEYEEIELDSFIEAQTLAEAFGITLEHLQFDNPALRPVVWDGSKRIPKGFVVKIQKDSLNAPINTLMARIASSDRFPIQTPDLAYVVQSGDSLSLIARRFKTSVAQLASLNQLADRHRLKIGQRLLLPQDSAAATGQTSAQIAATATNQVRSAAQASSSGSDSYSVRRGDTLSSIANKLALDERTLLQINNIDHPDLIYPGQTLRLPSNNAPVTQPIVYVSPQEVPSVTKAEAVTVPSTSVTAPQPATLSLFEEPKPNNDVVVYETDDGSGEDSVALELTVENIEQSNQQMAVDLAADPSDYSVSGNNSIEIQASETLGHYAQWLGVSSSDLRGINRMSARQPVVVGKRLTMDFSNVTVAQFELQRREFHLQEQQDFFRNYRIQNLDQYKVAANDNIGSMARRKYSVPMWLLRQYNPDLDFSSIQIGQIIVFPVLESVASPGSSD